MIWLFILSCNLETNLRVTFERIYPYKTLNSCLQAKIVGPTGYYCHSRCEKTDGDEKE